MTHCCPSATYEHFSRINVVSENTKVYLRLWVNQSLPQGVFPTCFIVELQRLTYPSRARAQVVYQKELWNE